MSEETVKITANLDSGKLTIDVIELLNSLTPWQKSDMMKQGEWAMPLREQFLEVLTNEVAGNSYNSDIHKLRELLLTSKYAPKMVQEFIVGLRSDMASEKSRASFYQRAYSTMYQYLAANHYHLLREIVSAPQHPSESEDWRKIRESVRKEVEALGIDWEIMTGEKEGENGS